MTVRSVPPAAGSPSGPDRPCGRASRRNRHNRDRRRSGRRPGPAPARPPCGARSAPRPGILPGSGPSHRRPPRRSAAVPRTAAPGTRDRRTTPMVAPAWVGRSGRCLDRRSTRSGYPGGTVSVSFLYHRGKWRVRTELFRESWSPGRPRSAQSGRPRLPAEASWAGVPDAACGDAKPSVSRVGNEILSRRVPGFHPGASPLAPATPPNPLTKSDFLRLPITCVNENHGMI
jgi:hypothetical protein